MAVFTLPPEMIGLYKEHIDFLTDHSVDPDKRRYAVDGEAPCHFIDIDHYSTNDCDAFLEIPREWNKSVLRFTEDTLKKYGIVPWHIQKMKYLLQKAFESKNLDLILKYSSEIGHYIGDAHVPLHTTENYNGQLTGQKGIHALWESRLVELNAENYDYFIGKSQYIPSVLNASWETIKTSHYALDSVLKMEKAVSNDLGSDKKYSFESRGNQTIQVYSYDFCQEYHRRLDGMVERRLRSAILMVGSIWYTAWVDAGQPDLSCLQKSLPSSDFLNELKELDVYFNAKTNKGRICEDH